MVITAQRIEEVAASGEPLLRLADGDIVTPAARARALELGVTLQTDSQASQSPSPAMPSSPGPAAAAAPTPAAPAAQPSGDAPPPLTIPPLVGEQPAPLPVEPPDPFLRGTPASPAAPPPGTAPQTPTEASPAPGPAPSALRPARRGIVFDRGSDPAAAPRRADSSGAAYREPRDRPYGQPPASQPDGTIISTEEIRAAADAGLRQLTVPRGKYVTRSARHLADVLGLRLIEE